MLLFNRRSAGASPALLALLVVLPACSADDGGDGGSSPADTAAVDAQSDDGNAAADATGATDSGAAVDAGTPEDDGGSAQDATTAADSGASDVGQADGGGAEDAAGVDSGADVDDCEPTNKGVETCDGVDNDCDGKTDNPPENRVTGLCDDGDMCTVGEACKDGKCTAGMALKCTGGACVDSVCDKAKGCVDTPNTKPCDDGNKCTEGDACSGGKCAGGAAKSCDDKNACTVDVCDAKTGNCKSTAKPAADCDDKNPCTEDACDMAVGCTYTNNSKTCDDGDACSGTKDTADGCAAGKCAAGAAVVCDDGNACTTDSCDKMKGCVHAANKSPCSDGNSCTSGEMCAAGKCGGGKKKCDDGKVCTADACDAKTGTCTYSAIPGCTSCKAASECNDKNNCTKDACTGGKCAHSPIKGCIGPTDYIPTKLELLNPDAPLGATAKVKFTVKNLGKPYGGSFKGKMQWDMWMSADQTVGAGDLKVMNPTKWNGYNIGAPKITEYTLQWAFALPAALPAGLKYICARVIFAPDFNKDNNTLCIQSPFKPAEFKVTGLKLVEPKLTAGAKASVQVTYKNAGGKTSNTPYNFYGSVDAKWDKADLLIGSVTGAGAPPNSTKTQALSFNVNAKLQTDKKHLCVLINAKEYTKEANPADNAICIPVPVVNPADLFLSVGHVTFTNSKGVPVGNPPWGYDHGCRTAQISNAKPGNSGPFKIRCWIGAPGGFAASKWKVDWTYTGSVPGSIPKCSNCYGKVKNVASTTKANTKPLPFGPTKLCMQLNYDKGAVETNYSNNTVCRPVSIVGFDLLNHPVYVKIGAPKYSKPGLSTLERGKAYSLEYAIGNTGNAAQVGANLVLGKVLLSKDKLPSKDDVLLWQGKSQAKSIPPFGAKIKNKPSYAYLTGNTKVTVATSVTPGKYYVLYHVNPDGSLIEPSGNNLTVTSMTIK